MLDLNQFPAVDQSILDELSKISYGERAAAWNKKGKYVISFKRKIKEDGLKIQESRCVWCTLLLGKRGHRTAHRDHIAPKGDYPHWTFVPKNLVLACEYCNGFSVKCALDTVKVVASTYEGSEFFIVHPYEDNVVEHISFTELDKGAQITINGLSPKGVWTVQNMKLDSPELTVLRAQDHLYQKMFGSLPKHFKALLLKATAPVKP
jgi:uncharacterized protein (TIGR02646 family)